MSSSAVRSDANLAAAHLTPLITRVHLADTPVVGPPSFLLNSICLLLHTIKRDSFKK